MKFFFLLLSLLASGFFPATAQHAATDFLKSSILQPPMMVFEPEADYDAATQNWSAHQLDDGRMLFANSRGLLLYDGTRVRVIDDQTNLRDFARAPDGTLYVSGVHFFGKLEADQQGRWQLTDLTRELPRPVQHQTFWQIESFGEDLYLRLRDGFVRYNREGAQYTPFNPGDGTWLAGNFNVIGDRLYIVINQQGLYEIRGDDLRLLHSLGDERGPNTVLMEDPNRTDANGNPGLLINTGKQFFSYYPSQNRLTSVEPPQEFLETFTGARPYKSHRLPNGYMAFGTVNGGLLVTDPSFNIVLNLDTDSGLPSNTVLNLFSDRENGLWLMTGNGLVRLDFFFPYWKSPRDRAFRGSVYQSIFLEDDLVVTTSEAVYRIRDTLVSEITAANLPGAGSTYHEWIRLPGEEHDELILETGLRYLATVTDDALEIIDMPSVENHRIYSLATHPVRPHYLVAAGTNRVTWHEFSRGDNGGLHIADEGVLYEGDDVYQQAFFDDAGSLWIGSAGGGFRRIFSGNTGRTLFNNPDSNAVQYFDGSDAELPLLESALVLNGRVIFTSPGNPEFFTFSRQKPAGEEYTEKDFLQNRFTKTPRFLSNPIPHEKGFYASSDFGKGVVVSRIRYDGTVEIPTIWNAYGAQYTNNQGGAVAGDVLLAASSHGLVARMPELKPWHGNKSSFSPVLSSVEIRGDSLFYGGASGLKSEPPAFDYERNQIRFELSPGSLMAPAGEAQYRSRLIPFDDEWSEWTERNDRTFTSLPPGSYRLEAESKNQLGTVSEPLHYEFTIITPFYRSAWAFLIYIGGIGLVIVFSSRKIADYRNLRTEEKMRAEQAEELEKINTLRSRMFTNIAHDLRTPITLMDAPVRNVLQNYSLPEKAGNELRLSVRSADRMKQLVDQIADLNRLETGRLKLFVKELDLAARLRMLVASFESLADFRHITLSSDIPDHPVTVPGDEDKLEKVITNLIDNAIKFSNEGGLVEINLQESESSVTFSVKDSGTGIPKDELPHIFDSYVSAGNHNADYRQGMGIGLTISREYVHLHHGDITAESQEGEYTLFTVTLPKNPDVFSADQVLSDHNPETGPASPQQPGVSPVIPEGEPPVSPMAHILLVEDNRDLAGYLLSLLQDEHYSVTHVSNGEKALAWLNKNTPDLIISDVMMPVMDGMELLQEIRRLDHLRLLPVIFLSAKTDLEGRMKSFRLGVNDYIHKPFATQELQVRIANLLEYSHNRKDALIEYEENESEIGAFSGDEQLARIRELVELHMTDSSFNLDAIATDVAMSKSTLYRYIKKETGLSAGNFVKEVRLQKAREYLESGRVKTVKEAALSVGYNHSGYFSGQFRERFGKKITNYL